MPSSSTLSTSEKALIKSVLPPATQKISAAALGRLYFAHPDPNSWSYSGIQGAVVLVHDKTKHAWFLRIVDIVGTRGILWDHEVYSEFDTESFLDRPFFFTFAGDECMIGIVFAEESEAKNFHKKVHTRKDIKAKAKPAAASTPTKTKSSKSKSRIDKSLISAPEKGSFIHVAHMGYDANSGFTSTNVDPSWTAFLGDLQGHGISSDVIEGNMDFIKDFLRDAQKGQKGPEPAKKKAPPPPAPRR
ncbi:PH domain-like protein, partial [Artomyces pyxidatus]